MKRKIFILTMLALSAGFVAFTAQEDSGELTKVSVVHHEGNQVIVLDTVFDPASGYTVEQFLLDHGLNPDETDIINADNLEGAHIHDLGHDVWFMDSEGKGIQKLRSFRGDNSFESKDGSHKDVRIEKTVDDEGNVSIRQFVNGEEVEPTEEDLRWIEEGSNASQPQHRVMVLETEDQEGDDEVFIEKRIFRSAGDVDMNEEEIQEMVDKIKSEHRISVDGDERVIVVMDKVHSGNVDPENLPEDAQMMEVEVEKFIDSNGNEQIQMWINGEEVDPADHQDLMNIEEGDGTIEIEIEMINGDDDGENTWIINDDGEDQEIIIDMFGGSGYTIAIVSSVSESEQVKGDEKDVNQDIHELAINDLRFSPNPNGGQFNLSFNLPEKGRTELVIYDLQGKRVYEEKLGKFSGEYNNQIDLSSAGPGTYILNILQGKHKLAEKIIVR
jgi:hypothetical protein